MLATAMVLKFTYNSWRAGIPKKCRTTVKIPFRYLVLVNFSWLAVTKVRLQGHWDANMVNLVPYLGPNDSPGLPLKPSEKPFHERVG